MRLFLLMRSKLCGLRDPADQAGGQKLPVWKMGKPPRHYLGRATWQSMFSSGEAAN
jgi:hypothetical protein